MAKKARQKIMTPFNQAHTEVDILTSVEEKGAIRMYVRNTRDFF
jgi:hypothetical protein